MTPSLQGIMPFSCPQSDVPLLAGLLQHLLGTPSPSPLSTKTLQVGQDGMGTGWGRVRALHDGEEGGSSHPCVRAQHPRTLQRARRVASGDGATLSRGWRCWGGSPCSGCSWGNVTRSCGSPPPQDKGWEAMGWLEWGHPCSN